MVGFPPKSSILIGFSILNHPFWGIPIFWKHPPGTAKEQFFFMDGNGETPIFSCTDLVHHPIETTVY